jgi:Sulfotransferase domain
MTLFCSDRKPTFFVIGAQKAGTTRLCHLLDRHPDIVIPTKEPFYFQSPEAMSTKARWYESLFRDAPKASVYGEGSTYYSMRDAYPGTAERIRDFDPAAKIIYMVRHPFRRIESAWYQLLFTREISGLKSFKRAVMDSDLLIEPTLYWHQLSAYRDIFPDDQIHIGIFEEFVQDEDAVLRECLRFLGVSEVSVGEEEAMAGRNASTSKVQPWFVLDLMRGLRGYPRIKRFVPERVRASLGTRMQKQVRAVPKWDSELTNFVLGRVKDDCDSLLEYLHLPGYWNLETAAPTLPGD